ncbi:MAG: tetratricopeptide repeat protein [Methanomassiliicoccus sp.]|nr:tetratricopeptide repeat protein [Methanomassiliicoccus sp.]
MSSSLTVGERIVLQLAQYTRFIDSYDAPLDVSQDGIAAALRISRAHAAIELKKLKETGEVMEKLVHIKKGKTKRKVYFLTSPGEERARKIRQFADSEGIDVQPFLDLKKCKGPELWKGLSDEQRGVLAQACVFRRPFRRDALPETTVSLLPVSPEGMVDMPGELRAYVPTQVSPVLLRQYHSMAADYWLPLGQYRERLYHLMKAGRKREAEMLLASKGAASMGMPDRDLLDIVMAVSTDHERYRGRVLYAQAEVARRTGNHELALVKAKELCSSSSDKERHDGMIIEALVLREKGDHDGSVGLLKRAAEMVDSNEIELQCELSDTLIRAGRHTEAKELLERLLTQGGGDGEQLERIFFQLGTVSLCCGDAEGAVRCFSKSRGAARNKENGELYLRLSDAYGLMGMTEKAEEYAVRAKKVHTPNVSM